MLLLSDDFKQTARRVPVCSTTICVEMLLLYVVDFSGDTFDAKRAGSWDFGQEVRAFRVEPVWVRFYDHFCMCPEEKPTSHVLLRLNVSLEA